jgi:hypothetical protein
MLFKGLVGTEHPAERHPGQPRAHIEARIVNVLTDEFLHCAAGRV